MQNNVPARTEEVFEYLKQCASRMRTATDGEVAAAVGSPFPPSVITPLNYIRDKVCIPRGLPGLSALAVNGETRMPSAGFLPDKMVISDADFPIWWRGMALLIFATDWTTINLENPN